LFFYSASFYAIKKFLQKYPSGESYAFGGRGGFGASEKVKGKN